MENEIGNNKKFVSKVLATVLALAMLLPIGLMITVGENPEASVIQPTQHIDQMYEFYKENPQIKLANARFDINEGPQGLAPELTIDEYGSRVDGWYIVQFDDAVQEMFKAKLHQLGAEIGTYVPNNAFMVKMSHEVKAQVEGLDFVQYVGIYQPAYKIDGALLKDIQLIDGFYAEDALAFIKWENLFARSQVIGLEPKIPVTIQVHDSENPYNVAAMVSKSGGKLIGISETAGTVRAEVSLPGIQALSFVNNIQFITPFII
jgi:hypothetical protein